MTTADPTDTAGSGGQDRIRGSAAPTFEQRVGYVMRLVEMGQLRIGPDNRINKQAVMRLLDFDRAEALVDAD